jgi:hypothetical protein
LLTLSLAGCATAPSKTNRRPPQVRVETLQLPLAISSELSGRILAPRTAEVRARVAGVVLKRVYREGSDVKQGDVLFRSTRHRSRPTSTAPRHPGQGRGHRTRRACKSSATPVGRRQGHQPPGLRQRPRRFLQADAEWPKPRRPWSAPA